MDQQEFIGAGKREKLCFRDIVLQHLKRILEISSHELKDGTIQTIHANYVAVNEKENTQISYMQAIENLAYVLLPYFDEDMKKVYVRCIKVINSMNFEIARDFKERITTICKELNKSDEEVKDSLIMDIKLRYSKKLFSELNLLLKRIDYLKSSIYGEDEATEEIEEELKE